MRKRGSGNNIVYISSSENDDCKSNAYYNLLLYLDSPNSFEDYDSIIPSDINSIRDFKTTLVIYSPKGPYRHNYLQTLSNDLMYQFASENKVFQEKLITFLQCMENSVEVNSSQFSYNSILTKFINIGPQNQISDNLLINDSIANQSIAR